MKKSGYTLIELVAVMAILSILLGGGFTLINSLNKIKKEIEVEDAVYRVYSILSYGKAYCRKNFSDGSIIIDEGGNSIMFKYRDKIMKVENLPSYISLSRPPKEPKVINVSDKGYLDSAGSLNIDYENRRETITISVGIDDINIK